MSPQKALDESASTWGKQVFFGLMSLMLYSELCKIMVNKVTFVSFRGSNAPLVPPLLCVLCLEVLAHRYLIEDKIR